MGLTWQTGNTTTAGCGVLLWNFWKISNLFPSREVVAFFAARKKPPLPSKIDSLLLLPPSRLCNHIPPPPPTIIIISSYLPLVILSWWIPQRRKRRLFCDSWMRNQGCQRFFHSGNTKAFLRISAFLFLSFAIIFLETAGAAEAVSYNSRAGFLREGVWSILAFSFFSFPPSCWLLHCSQEAGNGGEEGCNFIIFGRNFSQSDGKGRRRKFLSPSPLSSANFEGEGGRGKTWQNYQLASTSYGEIRQQLDENSP